MSGFGATCRIKSRGGNPLPLTHNPEPLTMGCPAS